MASQPEQNTNLSSLDLARIREPALAAVGVMFNRAIELDPDAPVVEDKKTDLKPPLPSKGALQDSEFGMMLLLALSWLGDDLFATTNRSIFERVVVALVKVSVNRVLDPLEVDEGGGGDHGAFFTGEPYSKHSESIKYSANLDAAMITVIFLALAVKEFNDSLIAADHGIQNSKLRVWGTSLRDAALFVILEGLKYAMECRVINNGKFLGFTCDPESNKEHPADGFLKREDRLFFTWTACETINDLIEWRDSYLNKSLVGELPQVAAELNSLITDLEVTLRQSAEWCEAEFLEEFGRLEAKDPKELVKEVNLLKGKRLTDQQRFDIAELATCVQHVYQLSQYAAIRSLVPKSVSLEEVRTILDKIDLLVTRSIIGSRLDESDQRDLFLTLTRKYSLGKWGSYSDDAWYPLVVRSLSGLLSRTLRDIGERSSKSQVLALTLTFERTLEGHVNNLIDRRPGGGVNDPDSALWSFAAGQPYVFYATQRTIFALMKYEEFLLEVDQFKIDIFEEEAPDVPDSKGDLPTKLARKLGEDFLKPLILKLLDQIPRSEGGELLLPSGNSNGETLPEEPWAKEVVRNWLVTFTEDFQKSQIAAELSQRTSELIRIKKYVDGYTPSPNLPPRKKENAESQFKVLQAEYESICKSDQVGPKLSQLTTWEEGVLKTILFEYLFRNYIERPVSSFEALLDKEFLPELWRLIQEAKGTQENISKVDPMATVL
jgi:hypothetical protein